MKTTKYLKKALLLTVTLLLLTTLFVGVVYADGETVEIPKSDWEKIQEILERLGNAENGEEITDVLEETFFSRVFQWADENAPWVSSLISIVLYVVVIFLYQKSGKYSLGLLNNNKSVVKAVNENTVSNSRMAENNAVMLQNSTATAKQSGVAQIYAAATLQAVELLIEKSNLDEAAKNRVMRIVNDAQEKAKSIE